MGITPVEKQQAVAQLEADIKQVIDLQASIAAAKAKIEAHEAAITAALNKMEQSEFISASGLQALLFTKTTYEWDEEKLLPFLAKLGPKFVEQYMPRKAAVAALRKVIDGEVKTLQPTAAAKFRPLCVKHTSTELKVGVPAKSPVKSKKDAEAVAAEETLA